MIDPFLEPDRGDISVNVANERPPFHPHMSAPYLREIVQKISPDASLEYFITIRHPVALLASYYKFFQPDEHSRYNFDSRWAGQIGMSFEHWVLNGRLGLNPNWKRLGPDSILETNLSPLSLEAMAMNKDESWAVDHIFRIEEIDKASKWLSEKLGSDVQPQHVNQSDDLCLPPLGSEAMSKVRLMMPFESELYGI
ncbi:hypothetical protein [Thalassovita autumnalis]|nr:hypothetical protein [Thalassovita autumnalis]